MNRKVRKVDQVWQVLGGGTLVGLLTAIVTLTIGRGKNRIEASAQEATAQKTAAEIGNETAAVGIDIYKLVNEAVQASAAELRLENQKLREELSALREEVKAIRDLEGQARAIFRRFYERFLLWNERGRTGPTPAIRVEDLVKLGLDDLVPSEG